MGGGVEGGGEWATPGHLVKKMERFVGKKDGGKGSEEKKKSGWSHK